MNNKETKILNGYQYFFENVFGFILGYWAIIAILLMIFGKNISYTCVYYIFGFKLSILNDYVVLTSLFLGFLTTILLAIKQHKKYQSLKAKNGD